MRFLGNAMIDDVRAQRMLRGDRLVSPFATLPVSSQSSRVKLADIRPSLTFLRPRPAALIPDYNQRTVLKNNTKPYERALRKKRGVRVAGSVLFALLLLARRRRCRAAQPPPLVQLSLVDQGLRRPHNPELFTAPSWSRCSSSSTSPRRPGQQRPQHSPCVHLVRTKETSTRRRR